MKITTNGIYSSNKNCKTQFHVSKFKLRHETKLKLTCNKKNKIASKTINEDFRNII